MSKLTKEQRLARLQRNLSQKGFSFDILDLELSREITRVEREMGFPIMGNYPLMKFLQQVEDLNWILQQEKETYK